MYRAVDPHSFFADPDPANFLIADPNYFLMRIRIQLKQICKKLPLINSFLELKKQQQKKIAQKLINHGAGPNLL